MIFRCLLNFFFICRVVPLANPSGASKELESLAHMDTSHFILSGKMLHLDD